MARGICARSRRVKEKRRKRTVAHDTGSKAARSHLTAQNTVLDVASDAIRFVPLIVIVQDSPARSPSPVRLSFSSLFFPSPLVFAVPAVSISFFLPISPFCPRDYLRPAPTRKTTNDKVERQASSRVQGARIPTHARPDRALALLVPRTCSVVVVPPRRACTRQLVPLTSSYSSRAGLFADRVRTPHRRSSARSSSTFEDDVSSRRFPTVCSSWTSSRSSRGCLRVAARSANHSLIRVFPGTPSSLFRRTPRVTRSSDRAIRPTISRVFLERSSEAKSTSSSLLLSPPSSLPSFPSLLHGCPTVLGDRRSQVIRKKTNARFNFRAKWVPFVRSRSTGNVRKKKRGRTARNVPARCAITRFFRTTSGETESRGSRFFA